MSTATELFTDITELPDFEASPPCGTMFVNRVTRHQFPCGKPSVIRMRLKCPCCERARTLFLCQLCYDDLHKQKLTCWYCYTQGVSKPVVRTVREMLHVKGRELYMRCVKARIVSWLNSSQVGAILPAGDSFVVLAVYDNGRYVEPETIRIPNSPADLWGPDGPVHMGPPPAGPEDNPEESPDEPDE